MKTPNIPKNEADRLKALDEFNILDTAEEEDFDDITAIAARICGTPIALISLVDEKRQWFKSHHGLDARETPREISFCGHVVHDSKTLIVNDSFTDDRFKDNPLVTGSPRVRFYAGAPLVTPEGFTIGTLCAIDQAPKQLSQEQIEALEALARQVMRHLELRRIHKNLYSESLAIKESGMKLLKGNSNLTIAHKIIVVFSLVATFFAWSVAKRESEAKIKIKFEREADQTVELIQERMNEYKDALLGATAAIHANGNSVTNKYWQNYATKLNLPNRLPGLNGIGFITNLKNSEKQQFLAAKVKERPNFNIHPIHNGSDLWPITYLEPVGINQKAIGLDLAFEKNRYEALSRARDSGEFQITAPVVLVQDSGKTPGFLFVSPVYKEGTNNSVDDRRKNILGAVYSPFVVKKLMMGVLNKNRRLVDLQIRDGNDVIYDERSSNYSDFDPSPLHTKSYDVDLFGRTWNYSVSSSLSFRKASANSQPKIVLFAGLLIDSLLFALFMLLSKTNKKALEHADQIGAGYRGKAIDLEYTNLQLKNAVQSLNAAKERAELADQTKSDFLYTMSHEIRTPLNGIIGMTSFLQETSLTKDQMILTETINHSGKTLLTIINDILDFSKIESGKMELEKTEFDFKKYTKNLLKPFEFMAQKKSIDFHFSCDDYPKFLVGDAGRVGQVITNLVSNAIKFTKTGGVDVQAKFTENGKKTKVKLLVKDTGIGIPEEAKCRMFKAFSQAEKSTNRNFGGTGLGLSISKRLTEMMGGNIGFESEYGKGTTFKVEIDFETAEIISESNSEQIDKNHPNASMSGRILVAEDNTTNQMVICRYLSMWGCKYHVAGNGNEVLDTLRDGEFDLILMDCQMPEMDGYEATRKIRMSNTLNKSIPIVALTANAVRGDELKCREAGMDGYLSKPIDKNALENVLRRYLMSPIKNGTMISKAILDQFDDLQVDGQPDFLIEVIDSFLRTSPKRLDALRGCLEKANLMGMSKEAHGLKSSSQTLGATELGEICQKLEDQGAAKDTEGAQKLFAKLEEVYKKSCEELISIKTAREANPQKKAA